MSIENVNSNLPLRMAVDKLLSNDKWLNGQQIKSNTALDIIEQVFTDLYLERRYKFLDLGHSLSTYINWSHIYANAGYSVWRYPCSNLLETSTKNILWLNGTVIENRGQASSETTTAFTKVFDYVNGATPVFNDVTTEAASIGGTSFTIINDSDDELYIGANEPFSSMSFDFHTVGYGYNIDVEYYAGTATPVWTSVENLSDDTSEFTSDGRITYQLPSNWIKTDINGSNLYWIKITSINTPTRVANVYSIIPGDSVIGLLNLSAEQLSDGDWAWCAFADAIYVTIKNSGNPSYEGVNFITSTSSAINLRNYYVYNNYFQLFWEDESYNPGWNQRFMDTWTTATRPSGGNLTNGTFGINLDHGSTEYAVYDTAATPVFLGWVSNGGRAIEGNQPQGVLAGSFCWNITNVQMEYFNGNSWEPIV